MEEYLRLSTNELRSLLEEERARFAEKQKVLLETKSKINRGKLSNVSSVTETTLNVFLRSCCEETEKEQIYVSNVIERVRATADHTRRNLEKVNLHAQELLKNARSDVAELNENLRRVKSGHAALSSALERRESRGRILNERKENSLRSSNQQLNRAENVFTKIESRIDSQIAQLESIVAERTNHLSGLQAELNELEMEAELRKSSMITYQEEEQDVQDKLRKTEAEFEQLQTQLSSRNKAKECAASDQARIESEVVEFRDANEKLAELISIKMKNIEENEAQIGQLLHSVGELDEVFMTTETETQQFEQSLLNQQEATKIAADEVVHRLESEVEVVRNQLAADTTRADIMDKMFGNGCEITPDEWKASIEKAKAMGVSNKEVSVSRSVMLLESDAAKSELEKAREDAKAELREYNMSQSRIRNFKKRIVEDDESRESNMRIVDSRIAQAMKELEELTNSKCIEAGDAFVTPNPARHSSLQDLQKASLEASRGLSDDSDAESVKRSVIDLPDGIVRRNAATQQYSVVRSPDASSNRTANGGTSTETTAVTNALENVDGDITMEGIPLSASIDHAVRDDKVENWVRTTPDNDSPVSGTTAEMMNDRFPKNIFNDTQALYESDITMDMDDDDMNLSAMERPPATATKTPPPTVRQSSSMAGIFMNDSDSDANVSVWDDDF